MAAALGPRAAGLADAFAEFPMLCRLLAHPQAEWEGVLRGLPSLPRSDHVEDGDLRGDPQDLVARMALDAARLCRRIGLTDADGSPTYAGRRLAGIEWKPGRPLSRADDGLLAEVLARQVRAHWLGWDELDVTGLLRSAARGVAASGGPWAGFCPGLLLGELRHLLALARHDALAAEVIAESLPEQRADALGRRRPGRSRTPTENLVLYADAVNAFHLKMIGDLESEGTPAVPTVTEARATAMLLDCAGLLRLLRELGPVQCLGAPNAEVPRSPLGPVPVSLGDGALWDRSMQAGAVALLMKYLMGNDHLEYGPGVGTFTQLGLDTMSRRATGNQLGDGGQDHDRKPREIAEHRKINKALAMELLTGLLLARLDTPLEVTCHCETRGGLPHRWAPPGLADVEAAYVDPPPGFRLVAEVSAKSRMSPDDYRLQLEQAFVHAGEVADRTGDAVYALVLNAGEFATDKRLQEAFSSFAEDKGLGSAPLRVVPMWGADLASAVQGLEGQMRPDALRFGNDDMREALDRLSDGALRAGDLRGRKGWMRDVWAEVATRQRRIDDGRGRRPPSGAPEPG